MASFDTSEACYTEAGRRIAEANATGATELNLAAYLGHLTHVPPELAELRGLRKLRLGPNPIISIAPLAHLTELEELDLCRTNVTDISPLAGLTRLRFLVLKMTKVVDFTPLAGLSGLEILELSETPLPHTARRGRSPAWGQDQTSV